MVVLIAAWSVASPVGSVPDSSFHLASIWCSGSAPPDDCPIAESIPGQPCAYLPSSLTYPTCFSQLPDGTRQCTANINHQESVSAKPNQLVGLNPPGFYSALGLHSGQPVEGRVVLMRITSGCFSALLIACSSMLLYREERRRFLLVALITHLPLGLFLAASVNSSGVTLAIVVAAVPFGVRLSRATRRNEWVALLAGVTLLLGAATNLRKESPILVLVVLLTLPAQRIARAFTRSRRTFVFGVSLTFVSAATLIQISDGARIVGAFLDGFLRNQGAGALSVDLVLTNAIGVPLLWFAAFGGWAPSDVAGLGLLDVVPPWPTALITGGAIAVLLRDTTRCPRSISFVSSTTLLGLSWLVPFRTLTISGLKVGEQLQPRYVLPLLASGIIAATLSQPSETPTHSLAMAYISPALTFAHFLALSGVVLHYSYDQQPTIAFFTEIPNWRWTTTHPVVTVIAGTVAFAVLAHLLVHGKHSRGRVVGAPGHNFASLNCENVVKKCTATSVPANQ